MEIKIYNEDNAVKSLSMKLPYKLSNYSNTQIIINIIFNNKMCSI